MTTARPKPPAEPGVGVEPLMSGAEVAAFLSVPRATLYAWRRTGYGPKGKRVGRFTRYRRSDVEAWLEGQR